MKRQLAEERLFKLLTHRVERIRTYLTPMWTYFECIRLQREGKLNDGDVDWEETVKLCLDNMEKLKITLDPDSTMEDLINICHPELANELRMKHGIPK